MQVRSTFYFNIKLINYFVLHKYSHDQLVRKCLSIKSPSENKSKKKRERKKLALLYFWIIISKAVHEDYQTPNELNHNATLLNFIIFVIHWQRAPINFWPSASHEQHAWAKYLVMDPYGVSLSILSPWRTIALAKCLESKYWHLPVKSSGPQIHRERGASWRDGKGASRLKKESKKETCVKLFPQTSWNWSQDAAVTRWTFWEPYFRLHTFTSWVCEALFWQHLEECLEYVQIL